MVGVAFRVALLSILTIAAKAAPTFFILAVLGLATRECGLLNSPHANGWIYWIRNHGAAHVIELLRAGFELHVFDVNPTSVGEAVAGGAQACKSVKELAAKSDFIVTMLPDVPEVESVMFGPEGVIENVRDNATLIEMSTIHPDSTRRVAQAAAAVGLHFLDAPVCRSSKDAEDGTLLILVGGEGEDLDRADHCLK